MMKLTEEVNVNAFVRPVCLPREGSDFTYETCVITGWGAAYSGKLNLSLSTVQCLLRVPSNKQIKQTLLLNSGNSLAQVYLCALKINLSYHNI